MDPLFLNLGLPQQAAAVAPVSTTPVTNQVNGLPQESKLATYISNRQQLSTSTQQPQQQQQEQQSPLTNSVAALSLDGVGTRKVSVPSVSSVAEFVPGSGGSGGLAHSSSTPSFHSFSGLGSPSLSTPSSLGFTPMTRSSPAATVASPQRPISPQDSPSRGRCSPQSGGGEDNSNASNLSTYQENVGGTTYFFTTQDQPSFGASGATTSPASFTTGPQPSLVFPPYHILPATPPHVHHLRAPNNTPHFFMGDELRNEILDRHAMTLAHVDPEQFPDIPQEIDMYHELVPLEPQHGVNKSTIFGYATSVYKATNIKTGLHYCLYRIHGFRLSNVKVTQLVDLWKKLQHSSVTQLREVFTTKTFNDNSIVFVYDYHAGAETLASRHFSSTNALTANGWEGLASTAGGNGSTTSHDPPARGIHKSHRQNSGSSLLPESTLWNYIIQLTGALRTIHTQGLSCRTLDPTKILLTDNKARIRVNCCGIHDVLNFDANVANPLASMPQYQQEDLVNLGKLMVALACNSVLALQRDNIQTALELINRSYSRDLAMLVVCLLTSQRIKSINDVMPMIGARVGCDSGPSLMDWTTSSYWVRFYTALETATQRADAYETEISKEVHNGRLFRLLTKLNTIVDRPQLHLDTSWCETGDRYMLKLFRDYVFHQVTDDGRPWLDLAHVVSVLNKLDAGSPDKICLMSHDEQNILVTSYAELKRCFERSFTELLQAASSHKTTMS
ncbi:PAN2-PAN3 deadenylation complex subunit pan3 isoform X1 [Procambarus clarkii]|uniref:PAN2-PAN3 deadenylation complex subunit pan3 isoform X1 n=1 Tax=Procambarus clarkii TaxID=6728 RepID=UPI001E673E46|nr:PAN2-PAN3 deadenylation complex subunit pan3-like isoform X1 [Procambarus clarkii]XP_045605366.1 PAN2-PAN3 deadenylation complex subunit pan3-like isoform X1 [Procambarus clarkii]XP_045605367.1 PAN2-PAN3 deadenylation complex subunit pan3-like isoform X1 [Procambarus clarkii]XP_045605368.1 PAN2-PAN3 deadenylation complex subunit pan3-like isoform X1 [Procambarus clarkii]XP_045605369.1 PAN2-PAN3 deadenylation complex subunit pan3-like isoform X1 [Procambarus clarkii]